jgi:hypothetical protein
MRKGRKRNSELARVAMYEERPEVDNTNGESWMCTVLYCVVNVVPM